jgi:hypothetical protein
MKEDLNQIKIKNYISITEAIEVFGEDARPILEEKLRDLDILENRYKELLRLKVSSANRKFQSSTPLFTWFWTQVFTIRTATRLTEIIKEKQNIERAYQLLNTGNNIERGKKVEAARSFPIQDLYQGRLKKAGKTRLVGLCPFHEEKTPSFYISTDKNLFHCFGCNVGGDSLAFLMRLENIDFNSALGRLA